MPYRPTQIGSPKKRQPHFFFKKQSMSLQFIPSHTNSSRTQRNEHVEMPMCRAQWQSRILDDFFFIYCIPRDSDYKEKPNQAFQIAE